MTMLSFDLISIIVPVYNIMEYLPRCVNSILEQTYTNLEVILIDDGSTDGTGKLCDTLAKKDERVRVLHKENGGSSSARNLGIRESKGVYLGFVDSDDYIDPVMYQTLMEAMLCNHALVTQTGRDEIDEKGRKLPNICEPPMKEETITAEAFLRELLLHKGDCSFCTKLIHKYLFTGLSFPEGKLNEDFYLFVKMLPRIEKVVNLPGQLYHVFYRIGSNSRKKTKEEFSRVFMDIVDNADMVEKLVWHRYPALRNVSVRFSLFQRLDYMLHVPISQMNNSNEFYAKTVCYLRKHVKDTLVNKDLTTKNKLYLLLFTMAPKLIREIHRITLRQRKIA